MTKKEALVLYDSGFWKEMTHRERAEFQMFEKRLCMPFSVFHEALEKTLGRPVYTHEFGLNWQGLQDELRGRAGPPSLEEIIEMIPADKRVLIVAPPNTGAEE